MEDADAQSLAKNSKAIADIDVMSYSGIYMAGGHGTCTDFYGNQALYDVVDQAFANGKVVAADCHGPIGLLGCKKPDGTPLVAGKKVTGFTDSEEAAGVFMTWIPLLFA